MDKLQKTSQALAKTTCEKWLTVCETPQQASKALDHIKTVHDSLVNKTPQMSLVKATRGEGYALGHIKLWLIYLQGNLNIKNKLSEGMIDLCSQTILDTYWGVSIGDIKIIFSDALKGVYGEFFESISIPKVISWFDDYYKKKLDLAEANSYSDGYNPEEKMYRERAKVKDGVWLDEEVVRGVTNIKKKKK